MISCVRIHIALLLAYAPWAWSEMSVASDDFLSPNITILHLNEYFGTEGFVPVTDIPLTFVSPQETSRLIDAPTTANCSAHAGTFVVIDAGNSILRFSHDFRLGMVMQGCGARGVIRIDTAVAMFGRSYLGLKSNMRQVDCCDGRTGLHIPILHVWHADLEPVFGSAQARANISGIDPNPWDPDYRDSVVWNVLLRGVVPLMNIVVVAICVKGVVRRVKIAMARKWAVARSFTLLSIGLVVELAISTTRCIYYAVGPNMLNANFTWEQHMYLINISMPFQLISICVMTLSLQELGAFGEQHTKKQFVMRFFVIGFVAVACALEVFTALSRARTGDAAHWAAITLVLGLVFNAVASISFLVVGKSFLRSLHNMERARAHSKHRTDRKQRFVRYIMRSSAARFVVVAAHLVAAVATTTYFTPAGLGSVMFVVSVGYALSSLFAVIAYFPRSTKRGHDENGTFKDLLQLQSEEVEAALEAKQQSHTSDFDSAEKGMFGVHVSVPVSSSVEQDFTQAVAVLQAQEISLGILPPSGYKPAQIEALRHCCHAVDHSPTPAPQQPPPKAARRNSLRAITGKLITPLFKQRGVWDAQNTAIAKDIQRQRSREVSSVVSPEGSALAVSETVPTFLSSGQAHVSHDVASTVAESLEMSERGSAARNPSEMFARARQNSISRKRERSRQLSSQALSYEEKGAC